VRVFTLKTWLLAVLVLLMPSVADAAGLGRLTILSSLGQPLNAEIDLVSVQKAEIPTLTARLASPDAYRQANLQYNAALSGARLSVEQRAGGGAFLRVTTTRALTEPFIDLIVELTWASGRIAREYTAFIDPPGGLLAERPAAPAAAPEAQPAPPTPIAAPETQPAPPPQAAIPTPLPETPDAAAPAPTPAPIAAAPATAPTPAAPSASRSPAPPTPASASQRDVKSGDTLFGIASSVKPDGVTLEQTLVGIYRSNPDAFAGNMNRLKSGRILRIPDKDELAAVTAPEATKEVRVQAANWNAYRQKLADSAVAAPEGGSPTSGRIATRVEDKAAPGGKDVVRLSKGEAPGATGRAKGGTAGERVRALEEEAVARDKALKEANERVAELEKNVKDMQRLLEIKNPALAQQQAKAAGKPEAAAPGKPEPAKTAPAVPAKPDTPAAAAPGAAKKDDVKPQPAPAEARKDEPKPQPAPAEAKKDESKAQPAPAEARKDESKAAPSADTAGAPAQPKTDAAASQPKPRPKLVPPPPPPPGPDIIDSVMGEPLYLAAAVGGLLLLGGLGYAAARRRRRSSGFDAPVRSAPTFGKSSAAESAAPAAAVAAAARDAEPAAAAAASAPADEVDPLAEAEVYIAYGRDVQAEEILKEAIAKEPTREELQVKLLEIYAARKDKSAFNTVAAGFHKVTGGHGESWMKVAAMGFALDAGNSLYAAGKNAPTAAVQRDPTATDLDFDLGTASATQTDITLESSSTSAADSAIVDPTDMGAHATSEPEPVMPDFTLDVPSASPAEADMPLEAKSASDPNMIDFNIELPKADDPEAPAAAPAAHQDAGMDFKMDLGDINLSMDDNAPAAAAAGADGKDGHWYDVQQKFDLAKAYQEMGDKAGAREILQEVMTEGDAEQKGQARTLLETLG
jgi:pilus assembly protein FimV